MASRKAPKGSDRGNLPQALKLLRTRLDVNRIELGNRLGLNRQRLYTYEHGINEPSFAVLRKMLTGMGFDLHDLQDALDAVEGRAPRNWRSGTEPTEEPQEPAPLLGGAETPVLLLFLRFFARMIAEELGKAAPMERA